MFKTKEEVIIIQAKATTPIPTGVVFWSHDKGTAKMFFQLQKDYVNQTLSEGTIVPICLDFVGGRHIYHAVIEDAVNGIVSIVLEDNILGYQGRVDGSIYIELPDSRSLDTAGRFTFDIKRSPIDENVPELEDYYWQGFNEIMAQYHQTIATIKLEAKTLLDSLTADVNTAQNKVTQLEQSISTANTNLNARINEINKKIDDNDVFTKTESSANVIYHVDQLEGKIDTKLANKADKTEVAKVEEMVSKMPSATPKETFTSLAALKSKYPNGNASAMVVLEADGVTGYVYLWDGSEWKKGALYQSQGIAEGTVTASKLSKKPENILAKSEIIADKLISGDDGSGNIVFSTNNTAKVAKIILPKFGVIEFSRLEPLAGQYIFAVNENNKMVYRKTFTETTNTINNRVGYYLSETHIRVDIDEVIAAGYSEKAIYISYTNVNEPNFYVNGYKTIDPAEFEYYNLEKYINIPQKNLEELSDEYSPYVNQQLLEKKILGGYTASTGEVSISINQDYAIYQVKDIPRAGTVVLPLSTVAAGQKIILEDEFGVCFYNLANNASTLPDYYQTGEKLVIDFNKLKSIAPRARTLYLGFKSSDISDWNPVFQNIKPLNEVFRWGRIDLLADNDKELVMPNKYPIVVGDTAYIYHDNVLRRGCVYDEDNVFSSKMLGTQHVEVIENMPASNQDRVINLRIGTNLISKSLRGLPVSASAGEGKTSNLMVIGESTSESDSYLSALKTRFDADVTTINFIGTRTSSGIKHEARSGWGSGTLRYVSEANNATNSFLNPATNEFDYAYYRTQNPDIPIPDYVLLNFGINDVNRYVTDGRSGSQSDHYAFIIENMRAVSQTIKFIVGVSTMASRFGNYRRESVREAIMTRNVDTIAKFDLRESEGIFLAPMYLNLDPIWDMPYSEIPLNIYNTTLKDYKGTDLVHPSAIGYKKTADVCYWSLKYALSLET